MDDLPYTFPEEDPFNVHPLRVPNRRRSTMLDKWIKEQLSNTSLPSIGTHIHPYLAYPDLHRSSDTYQDDTATIESFDLVEDDDIPQDVCTEINLPSSHTPIPKQRRRVSKSLLSPSSFRPFNLSFSPSSSPDKTGTLRLRSRASIFPLSGRHSTPPQHSRSTSISNVSVASSPGVSSKWRPSVLGHFSQPSTSDSSSLPSDSMHTPSRPSISSAETQNTCVSLTASTFDSLPLTPSTSKPSLIDSIRSHRRHMGSLSLIARPSTGHSCTSQNMDLSHATFTEPACAQQGRHPTSRIPLALKSVNIQNHYLDDDDDDINDGPLKQEILRPTVAYSSTSTRSRVSFSSVRYRSQKKKRKLVVSGIGPNDTRKFDNFRRWCESFGEVHRITRMPNGDLHVDFRDAEVADTVCRLRTGVYIVGVGSVQLSWFCGDKR